MTKIIIVFKSWDYIDSYTEPSIEQLKEKFPNDTFFLNEPKAEDTSTEPINKADSTNACLWQKITFWCKNIISKFTV